jgi:hypothetical protein
MQLEDAEGGAGVKAASPSCMGMLMKCKAHLHGSSGHLHKMGPAKDILPGKKPKLGEAKQVKGGLTCIVMLRQCKKALIDSNSHIATWGTKKAKALIKHKVIKKRKPKKGALTTMQKHCIKMAKISGMPLYSLKGKRHSFRGHWKKHCSGCISDGKKVAYNLMSNKCKSNYNWQRFKPKFMPVAAKGKECSPRSKGFKRTRKNDLISCINSCTGACKFVSYDKEKSCDTAVECPMVAHKRAKTAKPEIYTKTPTPQGFIPGGGAGQACSVKSKGFSRRQGVPDLHHCATMCKGSCKFITYNAKKDCYLSASCVMGKGKNNAEIFQRHK